jgi:hypothetical protein
VTKASLLLLLALPLTVVALAACAGAAEAPTATAPANPTPSRAETPSPTPLQSIGGVPVEPLKIGEPAEFPDDVALLIETGCWQCDGPTTGLERVYRDPSGRLRVDTLFSPEHLGLPPRVMQTDKGPQEETPNITGFTLTADASRIVVSVCTRGMCSLIGGPPSEDAQTTLFESTDGGITWKVVDVLNGGVAVRASTHEGLLLWDFAAPYDEGYRLYHSGERVEPPAGATAGSPFTTAEGLLLWAAEDGRILRTDGGEFLSLDLPPDAEIVDLLVEPGPAPVSVVTWFVEEGVGGAYYVSVLEPSGDLRHTYRASDLVLLGGWLGGLAYGNADVEPEQLPAPPPDPYLGWLPVALDFDTGTVAPIVDPFLERPSRNLVQAVLQGPFARVAGASSCLNVRVEPREDAEVRQCAADGVLLREIGESGRWVHVLTPNGTEGWTGMDYLER